MKKLILIAVATFMTAGVNATETNLDANLMTADELSVLLDTEGFEVELQEELDFENELLARKRGGNGNIDSDFGRNRGGNNDRWQPRRPRRVVCFAKNRRGERFRAQGIRPHRVRQRALRKCERWSRRCRSLGCRTKNRRGNDRWDRNDRWDY